MEAIILAGGFGTRLKNAVSDLPKPMAPINGVPFLSYIFNQLNFQGFTTVVLAVGYLNEKIICYYGNRYKNIDIKYSIEDEPLGTGGCIKKALKMTTEKYVYIINGDTYFNIDFSRIAKPNNIIIACKYMIDTARYGKIISEHNIVIRFVEKEIVGPGYINGGIYCLDRDVFDPFILPKKFSIEKDFFEKYLDQLSIQTFLSDEYFIDIGIPEDYEKAQRELYE